MPSRPYTDTQRAQKADYYRRNKERILAANRAWRAANPDKVAACDKAWREAHPLHRAANHVTYYQRNKDRVLVRERKARAELHDYIVKRNFCASTGLRNQDVPDELVSIIRTTALIKRELRAQRS